MTYQQLTCSGIFGYLGSLLGCGMEGFFASWALYLSLVAS